MEMPYAIRRRDDGLLLTWLEGDAGVLIASRTLRLACPCAGCHDELTGAPLLDPTRVPTDIRPVSVALVGGYGIKVTWSDGHDAGIFTFAMLHQATKDDREAARDG